MILLWGISTDDPLARVGAALARMNTPMIFLDQQTLLDIEMDWAVARDVSGALRIRGETIDLNSIRAAYLRPYDLRRMLAVEHAGPESPEWLRALALEAALVCWAQLTPALVVNRPEAMASNNSKPYQASLIRVQGFKIPETLITTDSYAARAFWEKHGVVIYKSISGVRSIVSRLGPEHSERLEDIANCPTQFQQYIAGSDFRVHVVGEDIFACEIISQADDYRYPDRGASGIEIYTRVLPPDLSECCRALTTALGLIVAGIDLRRTPQGEWFCFEVNPSPGFTFYEEVTRQPIGDAIARLLMSGIR